MAEITAAMVKELRDRTQAGMMEAKKILTETGGDMEAAIKALREKNSKLQVKEGRTSAEGVIEAFVNPDNTLGALVELNSETDFVARNEEFAALAKDLAEHAGRNASAENVEALLDAAFHKTGDAARQRLQETFAKLRENIIFKRFSVYETTTGTVDVYIHMGGKIGAVVELSGQGPDVKTLAKEVAMHVAAARPKFLKKEDVPASIVAEEREISRTRATADPKNANKPPEILEKIIEGGLGTYFKQNVLLEQGYVRDDKQSISQLLKGKAEIVRFLRYEIGEAIA